MCVCVCVCVEEGRFGVVVGRIPQGASRLSRARARCGPAARRLGGSVARRQAWVQEVGDARSVRAPSVPQPLCCTATRRGCSCAPVLLRPCAHVPLRSLSPRPQQQHSHGARACVSAKPRRAHDDAGCGSTHSPHPLPSPRPRPHPHKQQKAPRHERLLEARRPVLFPVPHRCAARPFFGDGPPGVRTFSLSQPSGPHAAWAATITRAKRHIDFIILSV